MPLPHSHAAAYAAHPNTVVTAICDISQPALDRYLELWGPANTYTDFREMLAKEQLDLVSIVTPDHLHAESFEAACDYGVKGIFCEKPIATTLADADKMIAAAERSSVQTVVNHTRRFDPFYRQARWLIEQGTIGEVRSVLVTLSGERAMLFRNGTHLIDTIGYLLDDRPAWTIALLDPGDEGYGTVYKGDGGRDPATDPGMTAIIGYRNGVRAHYNGVKAGVAGLTIELIGDKGALRIGNQLAELLVESPAGGLAAQPLPFHAPSQAGMVTAIDELIAAIERGCDGAAPLREARATLALLLGMLESADKGGARIELRA
jgi:predicted dehydrogenase